MSIRPGGGGAPAPTGGSGSVTPTPTKTANYTASSGEAVIVDASGGNFNVTLPAPSSGALVTVKSIGASGVVTVLPNAAETIDGAVSFSVSGQWTARDFLSNGTDWLVV